MQGKLSLLGIKTTRGGQLIKRVVGYTRSMAFEVPESAFPESS